MRARVGDHGGQCRGGTRYSDFWNAYRAVIPSEQFEAVGKESGKTNHAEHWNNTLQQRVEGLRKSRCRSRSAG